MNRFYLAIDRVERIDWSVCLKRSTSEEARSIFILFMQQIIQLKSELGIVHDPKHDGYPRLSRYFTSIAEELKPEFQVPEEVLSLCEKISTQINVRGSVFAILGCKAYIMWELMVQEYGAPAESPNNPYELLMKFFESGGMYETEHNMLSGFF